MVSVIIPTYKRANYIQRAINSVLNQTYYDIEIIVVDDNNPNTQERKDLENIMKNYKDNNKIIYIQHEKNKNGAAARNTGIKIAKGEYITFLDDDDFFLKDRIEKLVDVLNNNLEYNGAYTGCLICNNKKVIRTTEAKRSGNLQLEMLKQKSFFGTGSNLFIRREVLREINGFDESFKRHQDLEFMVRFFEQNKIVGINEYLVVKNQDSRINSPNMAENIRLKEYYLDRFETQIQKFNKNEIYGEAYFQLLLLAIQSKDKKNYMEILEKLKKYTKINLKMKEKILLEKLNLFINIKEILYFFRRKKINNQLKKEIKQEIKEIFEGQGYEKTN